MFLVMLVRQIIYSSAIEYIVNRLDSQTYRNMMISAKKKTEKKKKRITGVKVKTFIHTQTCTKWELKLNKLKSDEDHLNGYASNWTDNKWKNAAI